MLRLILMWPATIKQTEQQTIKLGTNKTSSVSTEAPLEPEFRIGHMYNVNVWNLYLGFYII